MSFPARAFLSAKFKNHFLNPKLYNSGSGTDHQIKFLVHYFLMLENGKLSWLWTIDIFIALNAILAFKFCLVLTKYFNCLNSDFENLRKRDPSFEGFSVTDCVWSDVFENNSILTYIVCYIEQNMILSLLFSNIEVWNNWKFYQFILSLFRKAQSYSKLSTRMEVVSYLLMNSLLDWG